MTKKIADLAVKTGTYLKDGQEKNRYENIGSVFMKEDGGKFLTIKRTFNPAGINVPDNKDSLIVSMFDVKPKSDAEKTADAFSGDDPFQ